MKKILLTGGTGYIGSHGAVALLEKGYEVVILDNLSNSKIEIIDKIEKITFKKPIFYQVDLKNEKDVEKVFLENKIDAIIHFAGLKAVGESTLKPFEYYENNIIGSLNLFKLMEKYNVKNIIFSSSATVYNPNSKPPLKEDDLTGDTTNPYGTTKFLIENILRDLSLHKGFRVINLRYFNPIGAHFSGLIGENPNDIPNNLLPYVMKVASGDLNEVKVFGGDYDTKDGTGERDYIHVVDLIEGHIKSLEYLHIRELNGFFEIFNLGTGNSTSVLEIINLASKIVGKSLSYSIVSRRSGDLAVSFCDPKKAEKLLGWKAQYGVEEGIRDSWNFIKNTKNIK